LLRYAAINALALAPLGLLLCWKLVKGSRSWMESCLVLGPFVVSIAETLAMRNYFCHHPWMASPALVLGALLSCSLAWATRAEKTVQPSETLKRYSPWVAAAAVFCFSLAIVLLQRAHNAEFNSMIAFIRSTTARSDVILVSAKTDPSLATELVRYREFTDRWFDSTDSFAGKKSHGSVFLLASQNPGAGWDRVAALSISEDSSDGVVQKALNWYSKSISRRKPGDQLKVTGNYALYQAQQNLGAKP
jgi:hypothetical protein